MTLSVAVYERHVFVCTSGEWCPVVDGDGLGVHARLKALVKQAAVSDRVRVNHAGCFSQCGNGPMVVIYPDSIWYAAVTPDDAEEIVTRHLLGGDPVDRLRYEPPTSGAHKLTRDAQNRPIGRVAPWPAAGTGDGRQGTAGG
ncbi:MAG: (2Fe-2S) ferredoxin domain-containing protein [Candidatus Limnocylindria bacterium]